MTPAKRRKPKKAPPSPGKQAPPTDRQREFLAAVAKLHAEGRDASAIAIAAELGIDRTGTRSQLGALARKGLVVDVPKVVSSGKWALTDAARALLEGEE